MLLAHQRVVVVGNRLRHGDNHLWHLLARNAHGAICLAHYVKNHIAVVGTVRLMVVFVPIRTALMYLHVAHPKRIVDAHFGIEEVRSGIRVVQSRIDNLHSATVRRE